MLSKGELRNFFGKFKPVGTEKNFVKDKKMVYPNEELRKQLGLEWEWVPPEKEGQTTTESGSGFDIMSPGTG